MIDEYDHYNKKRKNWKNVLKIDNKTLFWLKNVEKFLNKYFETLSHVAGNIELIFLNFKTKSNFYIIKKMKIRPLKNSQVWQNI